MTDEERLDELLLIWEERFDRGQDTPAEELCKECPELTAEMASRIQALKNIAWLEMSSSEDDVMQTSPFNLQTPPFTESTTLVGRFRLETLIAEAARVRFGGASTSNCAELSPSRCPGMIGWATTRIFLTKPRTSPN